MDFRGKKKEIHELWIILNNLGSLFIVGDKEWNQLIKWLKENCEWKAKPPTPPK